jgi:hypothetical protein
MTDRKARGASVPDDQRDLYRLRSDLRTGVVIADDQRGGIRSWRQRAAIARHADHGAAARRHVARARFKLQPGWGVGGWRYRPVQFGTAGIVDYQQL